MSTSIFRVMLATDSELDKLQFPLLASSKLDGVRAYVRDGVVLSRSNKPIPNKHVQALFGKLEHYDGELIVGEPTSKQCYRDTLSGVMSVEGEPDVKLYAFDHIELLDHTYFERQKKIKASKRVIKLEQHLITCMDTLLSFEDTMLNAGYEGLILRDPNAPYKQGRSTVREGYLLKLKRFVDAEATIIGYEERMHNANPATTNELGRTSRSSHASGKRGRGDLGCLQLRSDDGVDFSCGTGFTDSERVDLWGQRHKLFGRRVKYKYFPVGVKTAPRHPVFLGFRDDIDS